MTCGGRRAIAARVHLLGTEGSDELAEPDRVCEHVGEGDDDGDDDEPSACPSPFHCATASPSMIRQYGQDVAITSAPVPSPSSIRSTFIRLPVRSSIYIRAPPTPQQKPLVVLLCGQPA